VITAPPALPRPLPAGTVAVAAERPRPPVAPLPSPDRAAGIVEGGGPKLRILGVHVGKMAAFALLGAAAASVIPPLAVLGGPVGGAVAGALLSLIL
jgi:hypothetical protein